VGGDKIHVAGTQSEGGEKGTKKQSCHESSPRRRERVVAPRKGKRKTSKDKCLMKEEGKEDGGLRLREKKDERNLNEPIIKNYKEKGKREEVQKQSLDRPEKSCKKEPEKSLEH